MTDSLLRLLHLSSPALPIGAFAFSQGLEFAIESGWVKDGVSCREWLEGMLVTSLQYTDLAIIAAAYRALEKGDSEQWQHWNKMAIAVRETQELREEERQIGKTLLRLLESLGVDTSPLRQNEPSYIALYALASHRWHIPLEQATQGFLWSWCENQVAAACKLIPLGQTEGQKTLINLMPMMKQVAQQALHVEESQIGFSVPAQTLASSLHEEQYSRLFRS